MRKSLAAALLAAGFIFFCSRAPGQPAGLAVTIHSQAINRLPDAICLRDNVALGVLEAGAHHVIRGRGPAGSLQPVASFPVSDANLNRQISEGSLLRLPVNSQGVHRAVLMHLIF